MIYIFSQCQDLTELLEPKDSLGSNFVNLLVHQSDNANDARAIHFLYLKYSDVFVIV